MKKRIVANFIKIKLLFYSLYHIDSLVLEIE